MSYSISFLPPSQPRQSSVPRPRSATQSTLMAGSSCHESRTYLDKLNEQQQALVRPLIARVEHWKGHCLCSFGKPLLQAKTMISRTPPGGETSMNETSTRQYQVFLFSNILVCCRKRSRPNAQGKDWTLKGRVFLRNVYDVERVGETKLHISYHGDDGADSFTIDFTRPALLDRWATVLEHFRERATAPRALEEGSSSHSDVPPPAYYSPLPEYTSIPTSILSAPPMERHSPVNTPLSTPPLYTPSETFTSFRESACPSQYPCRPSMTTTLSTSSIGSVDPDYVAEEQQDSFRSLDKLEDATAFSAQPIKFAYALVSAMASGPVIYRSLALLSVCLYMTYLGISYRRAFVPDDGRLEVH